MTCKVLKYYALLLMYLQPPTGVFKNIHQVKVQRSNKPFFYVNNAKFKQSGVTVPKGHTDHHSVLVTWKLSQQSCAGCYARVLCSDAVNKGDGEAVPTTVLRIITQDVSAGRKKIAVCLFVIWLFCVLTSSSGKCFSLVTASEK